MVPPPRLDQKLDQKKVPFLACRSRDWKTDWSSEHPFRVTVGLFRQRRRELCPARFCLPLQAFQVGTQISSMLVAQIAILLERLVNDPFQFGGQVGIQPYRGHGRLVQDGIKQVGGRGSPEWQLGGGHLVQHRPEGEQVGAGVKLASARLLRRHICGCAHRRTRTGKMRFDRLGSRRLRLPTWT